MACFVTDEEVRVQSRDCWRGRIFPEIPDGDGRNFPSSGSG